ncbi:MAG: hypothetical protein NTZ42_00875 [Candidatus Gribaldobacteria bacterium]|nr:hypothetical protein [Candidatus Gribaldobacteria bacterium]
MKSDKENLNTILDTTFKFAKKTAKDFYFKIWAKNPPKCPAFDGEMIHISRYGWEHLTRLRKRTKFELLGRLFVLERARELLETSLHFQLHVQRKDMDFWIFEAEVEGVRLKVVVRSIQGDERHFYSVIRKGSAQKEIDDGL